MRISDWSSDVCSSDLIDQEQHPQHCPGARRARLGGDHSGRHHTIGFVHFPLPAPRAQMSLAVSTSLRRPASLSQKGSIAFLAHRLASMLRPERVSVRLYFLSRASQKKLFAFPFQRSEEHTSELQSLMRTSYAVFC